MNDKDMGNLRLPEERSTSPPGSRNSEHEVMEGIENAVDPDAGSTTGADHSGSGRRGDHSARMKGYHDNRGSEDAEAGFSDRRRRSQLRARRGQAGKEQFHEGDPLKRREEFSFDDAETEMVLGGTMSRARRNARRAAFLTESAAHAKVHEQEDENAGIQAAHQSEIAAEAAVKRGFQFREQQKIRESGEVRRRTMDAAGRAADAGTAESERKGRLRWFFQRQRYKKMYAAGRMEEQAATETIRIQRGFAYRAKAAIREAFTRKSHLALVIGILIMMGILIAIAVSSCSASIQGISTGVMATTYPSEDGEIYKVENAYADMEARLNAQISRMESTHPGYDEYRYQVDEISHNPYHLISYFTAKYGQFTYSQVKGELKEIFQQQYGLKTKAEMGTVTEKKTIRAGDSLGKVVTSGYCNCPICCGIWSGGPTASGKYPKANHTIAVDASNPFVPMGTHVIMNGTEYVVEDTGAFARFGVQFDVYYGSHSEASAHGHKTWEAYLADSYGKKEITVTTTKQVNRLNINMINQGLDAVLQARLDKYGRMRYELYNTTYGNRDYLFDLDSLPVYAGRGSGGSSYQIPPEALSDQRFARMIREAEKYLGYPYVWGGSSPSTSFDCSGFVSWVVNHCGNGWSVGRLGADGLRKVCVTVSPSNARPGDLIFFQNTYPCGPGASHVGIYVGNGMMIHCGDPIQYTSVKAAYWQQHFLCYGRLP